MAYLEQKRYVHCDLAGMFCCLPPSLYQCVVIPKSLHVLLNPLIYNERSFVAFDIFNPVGIVLTAFFLMDVKIYCRIR